ncbi:class I lanthipeptide [Flavobacterium amniphilum]|uniref:class I lanthipeptide n=1 Tax=Flavobacterium amniphilum TaxID=1834035 RepID=UPI00202ABA21|nr:class I lanthipeptide [Flavobacterium amniphilum]MCL9807394.1 class I lanthipeptide [Flavobacterium amniphilum]
MKKQNVNSKLAFDKKSVAELNSKEMEDVLGGTNAFGYPQVVIYMTPAIFTSGLIGEEGNAN